MRASKFKFVVIALAFLVASVAATRDPNEVARAIGDQVYCMCGGCVGLLNHCPHPDAECSTKREMRAMILKEAQAGKGETQILQDLVLRYGVAVLASPPAKGFDWMVWVLPPIGVIVGLALVVLIVRRWRGPRPEPPPPAPVDEKLLQAVDEELKKVVG